MLASVRAGCLSGSCTRKSDAYILKGMMIAEREGSASVVAKVAGVVCSGARAGCFLLGFFILGCLDGSLTSCVCGTLKLSFNL